MNYLDGIVIFAIQGNSFRCTISALKLTFIVYNTNCIQVHRKY